jgi:hypothetical protein
MAVKPGDDKVAGAAFRGSAMSSEMHACVARVLT